MRKEEIIINDINVCDCNAYKDGHCKNETSIMFTEYNLCSNFPNCYYKQLQKSKEEIKALEKKKNKRITSLKQMIKKLNHEKACAWGMLVPVPYSHYNVHLWGEKAFGKEYVEKARKAESEQQ